MKSNNPFFNHDIFWLSHSSMSTWIQSPSKYIAEKLFKISGDSSASMHRGTSIEHALAQRYYDGIYDQDVAESKFNELCNFGGVDFGDAKRHKENIELKNYGSVVNRNFKYENLEAYQEKVEIQLEALPIPIIGYIDFVFADTVVDLKTTARMPSKASASNKRQLSIYAMHYKDKKSEVFYASPKEHKIFEITKQDIEIYQKQVRYIAMSIMKFLSISSDKEELASMVLPDVDDWKWSEEMINEVKDKVQAWKGIL